VAQVIERPNPSPNNKFTGIGEKHDSRNNQSITTRVTLRGFESTPTSFKSPPSRITWLLAASSTTSHDCRTLIGWIIRIPVQGRRSGVSFANARDEGTDSENQFISSGLVSHRLKRETVVGC
jgi:hypothetical protein